MSVFGTEFYILIFVDVIDIQTQLNSLLDDFSHTNPIKTVISKSYLLN